MSSQDIANLSSASLATSTLRVDPKLLPFNSGRFEKWATLEEFSYGLTGCLFDCVAKVNFNVVRQNMSFFCVIRV